MVEPLRHRQTKEAATDMFSLKPPRHIPTLPFATVSSRQQTRSCPLCPEGGSEFSALDSRRRTRNLEVPRCANCTSEVWIFGSSRNDAHSVHHDLHAIAHFDLGMGVEAVEDT